MAQNFQAAEFSTLDSQVASVWDVVKSWASSMHPNGLEIYFKKYSTII